MTRSLLAFLLIIAATPAVAQMPGMTFGNEWPTGRILVDYDFEDSAYDPLSDTQIEFLDPSVTYMRGFINRGVLLHQNVGRVPAQTSLNMTIAVAVKFYGLLSYVDYQNILTEEGGTFSLRLDSDGVVHFDLTLQNGREVEVTSRASLRPHHWYLLVATVSNRYARLFLADNQDESDLRRIAEVETNGSLRRSVGMYRIGASYPQPDEGADFILDKLRIYNHWMPIEQAQEVFDPWLQYFRGDVVHEDERRRMINREQLKPSGQMRTVDYEYYRLPLYTDEPVRYVDLPLPRGYGSAR